MQALKRDRRCFDVTTRNAPVVVSPPLFFFKRLRRLDRDAQRTQGIKSANGKSSGPHTVARAATEIPAVKWGLEKKEKASPGGGGDGGDEDEASTSTTAAGWGFFDLSRLSYRSERQRHFVPAMRACTKCSISQIDINRWQVPWGFGTTAGGMVLWLVSFAAVGFVAVPGAYRLAGVDIFSLDARDKAIFTFVSQVPLKLMSMLGPLLYCSRPDMSLSLSPTALGNRRVSGYNSIAHRQIDVRARKRSTWEWRHR